MDPRALEISRLLPAPATDVWAAWTDPKVFVQWWVPRPWRAELHRHEVLAGGGFDMTMHGPQGERVHIPGCFLFVEPLAQIVFTSTMSAGFQPEQTQLPFTAQILIAPQDDQTLYTARALHPNIETRQQHEEMGFAQGWGAALDQLAALLTSD